MIGFKRNFTFFTLIFLAFFVVIFSLSFQAEARSKSKEKSKENAKYAAIVVDVQTGVILHQENASKKLYPASLTKMMTLLMLFDAMKRGQVDLDDRILISKHAASMAPSKLGLKPGSSIKVEDAILALVTKSANDIAVAIGEHLGRTEGNFARLMTAKARQLDMTQTVFKNASGLHNPAQVSTARDMARLGLVLIADYRNYYHYFSTKNFKFRGASYHNHNRLMLSYKGMDGLKTGYTVPSGFNLVSSAVRDGRRVVGVVFGGKTAASRNERMRVILDEGFAKLKARGQASSLVASAADRMSVAKKVPVPEKKPVSGEMYDVAALGAQNTMAKEALDIRLGQEQALLEDGPEDMSLAKSGQSRWEILDDSGMLVKMTGQGDYDNDVRSRIETGLIAVSAQTGQLIPQQVWGEGGGAADLDVAPKEVIAEPVAYNPQDLSLDWAIQIGAFTSRDRTDKAIAESIKKLPINLRTASAIIAPVQTPQGWVFRARLSGYTKAAAEQACAVLVECIPIAPYAK